MGRMRDGCIECPYHGWLFDDKGVVTEVPAGDGDSDVVDNVRSRAYSALECGPFVWFMPGGSTSTFLAPVAPEMFRPNWIGVEGETVFDADLRSTLENSIDVGHVNFVHSEFGDAANGAVDIRGVERTDPDRLVMKSVINHKSENALVGMVAEQARVHVTTEVLLPNTVIIRFTIRNTLNLVTYVTFTPLSQSRTKVCWSMLRSPRLGPVDGPLNKMFRMGMEKAFLEDRRMVESLDVLKNRVNVPVDEIQYEFEKALSELID